MEKKSDEVEAFSRDFVGGVGPGTVGKFCTVVHRRGAERAGCSGRKAEK
jgi:hypothetical protein